MCITSMLRVSTTNTKTKTKSKPKRKIKLKTVKRTTKRITSTELLLLMLTATMSIVTMTVRPATATAAKTTITTTTTTTTTAEREVTRTTATMTTNVVLTSTTTEMRGLSSTQQQQRREEKFQQQQQQKLALVGADPADETAFAMQTQFRSPVSDDGTFVSPSRSSRSSNNNNNHNNMGYYVKDDYHSNAFLPSAASSTPLSPSSASSTFPSSPSPQTPPVFDFGLPRNITARSGQTAAINCRVENLGDKSVSWIRKRDLHILTAGILTYTSDERFRVIRTDDSENWSLHVKFAQPRDSGIYECQVNTEPKISMAFRLNVIVTSPDSTAIIAGPTDLYAKVGSSITLNCRVKQPSSQEIGPIHWYRGPYIITPFVVHPNDAAIDLSRRISMESQLGDILKSRLRIANAQTTDSGNYTCMPTTAEAASVMVHVINDEHPAAMQKSAATTTTNLLPPIIIIIGHLMESVQLLDNLLTFLRTS